LVARIPGLKSETWGTHRLVAEGVRDEEKDCRSLRSGRDDKEGATVCDRSA
jgi:hypothetical protein